MRYAGQSSLPLRQNPWHQYAASRALALYNLNAVYSFIPKNACSTLRYSLAIDNGFIDESTDVSWIHGNNETFIADQRLLATCEYAFVVLRCPYRRLASAFLNKVVEANVAARTLITRSFDRAANAKVTTDEILALSFADFVRICAALPDYGLDQHWAPQSMSLVYKDYDDWFSVERFEVAVEKLGSRGLKVVDTRARLGHSAERYRKVSGAFTTVPAGRLATMKQQGELPDPESLYDDETRRIVAERYAADIAIFSEKCGTELLLSK